MTTNNDKNHAQEGGRTLRLMIWITFLWWLLSSGEPDLLEAVIARVMG